jgi:hypothetical protein
MHQSDRLLGSGSVVCCCPSNVSVSTALVIFRVTIMATVTGIGCIATDSLRRLMWSWYRVLGGLMTCFSYKNWDIFWLSELGVRRIRHVYGCYACCMFWDGWLWSLFSYIEFINCSHNDRKSVIFIVYSLYICHDLLMIYLSAWVGFLYMEYPKMSARKDNCLLVSNSMANLGLVCLEFRWMRSSRKLIHVDEL